jgi:DNA-binding LacI/PurR family transcriptional regulator
MRARLADIAVHAGVSEATVSRVLNGKPGVAGSTRQAVLTALDVLGTSGRADCGSAAPDWSG